MSRARFATVVAATAAAAVAAALLLGGCGDDDVQPAPLDAGTDTSVPDAASSLPDASLSTISEQALVDACASTSACGVTTYPILASCVDAYYDLHRPQGLGPLYASIYACVNKAGGDCDAVAACFGRRGTCSQSTKATCEGDVAVSCDLLDKRIYAFDCSAAGLRCGVPGGQSFSASCTPGSCDSSYTQRCHGQRLLGCSSGVITVQDCLAEEKFCATTKSGAACRGNRRQSCDAKSFSATCLKGIAVSCEQGHQHWEDCAGNTLQHTVCKAGHCAPAGAECDHNMNRCAGDKLEVCLDGRWEAVACKQLGLGVCKPNGAFANCTPPKS